MPTRWLRDLMRLWVAAPEIVVLGFTRQVMWPDDGHERAAAGQMRADADSGVRRWSNWQRVCRHAPPGGAPRRVAGPRGAADGPADQGAGLGELRVEGAFGVAGRGRRQPRGGSAVSPCGGSRSS